MNLNSNCLNYSIRKNRGKFYGFGQTELEVWKSAIIHQFSNSEIGLYGNNFLQMHFQNHQQTDFQEKQAMTNSMLIVFGCT